MFKKIYFHGNNFVAFLAVLHLAHLFHQIRKLS